MLNKSIFFSKVPKYLYHKDKTPYFTNPKEMTLVQSQYELFSYGVLIGTIFSFIGLAAFLNYKSSSDFVYLIWIVFSLSILASIHFTIKKSIMLCCVLISIAPSILVSHLIYDQYELLVALSKTLYHIFIVFETETLLKWKIEAKIDGNLSLFCF